MLLSCMLAVWTLYCHLMPAITRQGGYVVDSIRVGLSHNGLMFSNESKFVVDFHDGWQRVWHQSGEHSQPPAVIAHDCYGGGSVMILGGITMTGRTELHICQGNVTGLYYRDDVSEPIVVPHTHQHGNAFTFRDSNARAHCACLVQDHLQFCRITTLPWPVKSPVLFPTEDLCDILRGCVQRQTRKPESISHQWVHSCTAGGMAPDPQATFGQLIRSMRHHCLACLAANGDPTCHWDLCEIDKLTLTKL